MRMLEIHRSKVMVILEVDYSEFERNHFDDIWDDIRDVYEEELYKLKKIERKKNKMHVKLNIKRRRAYLKERKGAKR
jgi:hypothetical protein